MATELLAENRKRESARADAGDQAEEAAGGGSAKEGEQPVVTRRRTGPEACDHGYSQERGWGNRDARLLATGLVAEEM